ncbi:response regulator transcription factor [Rudanella lutea]|uniref:response regulator transcription factor n=1 Tax=Rudanella lutea TaxID=451374 RepID=UPI000377B5AF|nr:response regulator transcription factor [Rudanella lutea]
MKLLLIEDEPELASSIAEYLTAQGYGCERAATYRQAVDKIEGHAYDCILLDLMLPDGSGLRLLEELKAQGKSDGVIIISANGSLDDKIRGLQIGADDYLTKPFHLAELAARVHSLIRRRQFGAANLVSQHELELDLLAKTVRVHGQPLALTKTEYDLLLYLVGNKNRVISKSTLAEHLSGDWADLLDSHDFVYAHIKNLKKKLQAAGCRPYLKTLYGTGYKWES